MIEERALALLGMGIQQEQVAAALGVTPSRISQLLSDDHFAKQVSEARFASLQKHNVRDDKYNNIEDTLLTKLEKSLPLLIKPESILAALKVINGATRRGSSAPASVTAQQTIVQLVLPEVITQKFAVNINNQVIKAGEQDLITMKPNVLAKEIEENDDVPNTITYRGMQL